MRDLSDEENPPHLGKWLMPKQLIWLDPTPIPGWEHTGDFPLYALSPLEPIRVGRGGVGSPPVILMIMMESNDVGMGVDLSLQQGNLGVFRSNLI